MSIFSISQNDSHNNMSLKCDSGTHRLDVLLGKKSTWLGPQVITTNIPTSRHATPRHITSDHFLFLHQANMYCGGFSTAHKLISALHQQVKQRTSWTILQVSERYLFQYLEM